MGLSLDLVAGDIAVVPAGVFHRFEPVDCEGYGFESEFDVGSGVVAESTGGGQLRERVAVLLAGRRSLRTDAEGLAGACSLSASHLAREFRRETGTSLHTFHRVLAVRHAKSMLQQGLPIVEAALSAGFFDQAHLTREFVSTYGFTPRSFQSAWAAGR